MTREEEINKGWENTQWIFKRDFIAGAKWADEHPKNPWRDAKKELPIITNLCSSDAVLVKEHNGGICLAVYYDIRTNPYWEIIGGTFAKINVDYWMPIPELKGGEK